MATSIPSQSPPASQSPLDDLQIHVVTSPTAFYGPADDGLNSVQQVIANAFGRQTRDALWRGMNPSWDTPAGARASAERTLQRWKSITTDKDGQRNTIYLIATIPTTPDAAAAASAHVPDGENEARTIVGIAIWAQISEVPGYGDPVHPDIRDADGKGYNLAAELYPDDKREQRYIAQAIASLVKRRKEVIREKAAAFENRTLLEGEKPANFHLDLCVVDPVWQRRGIAQKLVGWGLAEARRRGGLECSTEASDMGRGAYMKLGFKPEGDEPKDIVFEVDEEFKNEGRASLPPNLFLRTGVLR